jgi:hypothetical protein
MAPWSPGSFPGNFRENASERQLTSHWRGALAGAIAGGVEVLRFLVFAIAAIFRPKARLIAENICLRQQLLVLQLSRRTFKFERTDGEAHPSTRPTSWASRGIGASFFSDRCVLVRIE